MNRNDYISHALQQTRNVLGEVWECGTFKGELALHMKLALKEFEDNRTLRIFDTFCGQPFSGPKDKHPVGSMGGVNFSEVETKFSGMNGVYIYSGIMPNTFSGLENTKLSFTNIDVDNYDSVKACLEFVYPRTSISGWIWLDDYGCPNCPGAKIAVNEFLKGKPEIIEGPSDPCVYIIKK